MENVKKKKVRGLTLIAGIIFVLLGAALLVLMSVFAIRMATGELAQSGEAALIFTLFGGWVMVGMILLVLFIIAAVVVILGARLIKIATMTNEKYAKRKGSIIGCMVFVCIIIFLVGASFIASIEDTGEVSISVIFYIGLLVLSFVFILIDYKSFHKKVAKGIIVLEDPTKPTANIAPAPNNEPVKPSMETELIKLKEMREKEILTEEEYQQARKKVLDKHMGK